MSYRCSLKGLPKAVDAFSSVRLETKALVKRSGSRQFVGGPQVSAAVAAVIQKFHEQGHQFCAQADAAIFRRDQEIAQLGDIAAVHQDQGANHAAFILANPDTAAGRVVLVLELAQSTGDVGFEL